MSEAFQYDVFLSHNQADKPRVRRLAERLRVAGLRVWFDEWIIKPGDDIYLAIERGLEAARVQVLCLSPAALGSEWVNLERSTVLFRDPANTGRRFIPLLLADCRLPDTLRRYRYVDYRKEADSAFEALKASCRSEIEASETRAIEQTSQVIAVHLHPDFRHELGRLLEVWNSTQTRLVFSPVRPPRDLESTLLSASPIEVSTAQRLAAQMRDVADFEKHDGIFLFCEGRLFGEGYYQLFSYTTWLPDNLFDSSVISLFMKRRLTESAPTRMPLYAMMIQSMLYALGGTCGLPHHEVTRTCIMDFDNEMTDMLLGLDHGPKFCPHCERALRSHRNEHLLALASTAKELVHRIDDDRPIA